MARFLLTLFLAAASSTAWASLVDSPFQGIAVTASNVLVLHRGKILFFDHEGTFEREVRLEGEEASFGFQLLGASDDGRLWLRSESRDDRFLQVGTTFWLYGPSGEKLAELFRDGVWAGFLSRADELHIARLQKDTLVVERVDLQDQSSDRIREIPLASLPERERPDADEEIPFVIEPGGRMVALLPASETTLAWFSSSGEHEMSLPVEPDPVTPVSYMKDIFIDGRDGIYATHGSWEVSAAHDHEGSVLKVDRSGQVQYRITKGVGYLQHIAVTDGGEVFLTELSESVFRYDSSGALAASWIGVPPRFGESWDERDARVEKARAVGGDSTTPELLQAVIYGTPFDAERELSTRGEEVVAEAASALSQFPTSWELQRLLERLCERYPEAAVRSFVSGSRDVRRALAVPVANADPPPPGVQQILVELVRDRVLWAEEADDALARVGVPEELVVEYIAAARREWAEKPDWGSSPAYRLKDAYRDAQPKLGEILRDPSDPDRNRFRNLVLEASLEYRLPPVPRDDSLVELLPPVVLERTRAWFPSEVPYLADTAAIALTGFGLTGYEDAAVQSIARDPELLRWVLEAFAALVVVDPGRADRYAESLAQAVRRSADLEIPHNLLELYLDIGTKEFVVRGVRLLRDPELSPDFRGDGLLGLDSEKLPRPLLVELLEDESWHRSMANQYFFYSFLEKAAGSFAEDEEVVGLTRAVLLRLLTDPDWLELITPKSELDPLEDVDGRTLALEAFGRVFRESDFDRILPLATNPELPISVRYGALQLLSRVEATSSSRNELASLLENESLRFLAARTLSRWGEPRALDVLVEDGLKRMGPYSHVELDEASFAGYGEAGEEALLSLLSYPNRATQRAVRTFLGKLGSERGVSEMRAELAASLEAGEDPPPGSVEGLIAFGDNPLPQLVDSLAKHPEFSIWLEIDCADAADLFRSELESEVEPERARILRGLLEDVCGEEAEQLLREIAANHPVGAVKSVLTR